MTQILAANLDHLRAFILKITMQFGLLRAIFCDRPLRLLVLFLISSAFSLSLALAFPLWLLAIGPLVYGIPHLFSSVRYFHYTVSSKSKVKTQRPDSGWLIFAAVFSIMTVLAVYRIILTFGLVQIDPSHLSEWKGASGGELIALVLTVIVTTLGYRQSILKGIMGTLLLMPLFAALVVSPYVTVGVLILVHNFVGFGYWYLASKTLKEKGVVVFAGLSTLLITALIFSGWFDAYCPFFKPEDELPFAHLNFADLGRMVFPWTDNPSTWIHVAIVYAYSQAVHYYVWLKAIPDQHHVNEIPTSFKQSLRLMEDDFGAWGARFAIVLSIAGMGTWFFLNFYQARIVYFCIAGYHGYLEIAGLALILVGFSSRRRTPPYLAMPQ